MNNKTIVTVCLITAAAAIVMKGLLVTRLGTGPLLYVVAPFLISTAVYLFLYNKEDGKDRSLVRHLLMSLIIFFGASVLMFEGFICVLMFAPIYIIIVIATFVSKASKAKREKERALRAFDNDDGPGLKAYMWPVLIFAMATDGMLPQTTFPRERTATYVTVTDQNIDTLKENMAKPLNLPRHENWWLQMFPAPDHIIAGTLEQGDTHTLHFTYKRWIWSNFQKGEMDIHIAEVGDEHIRTDITKNTSYLSHYMKVEGTDVRFTPLENGQTEVSLTVSYQRLLDPAWYFGPLQQFAADKSAEYLVEKIIVREEGAL